MFTGLITSTLNLIQMMSWKLSYDSYEETCIYNRFSIIAQDKSAVIVTHRLGSMKLADRILVMKEGKAVQLGTQEELMAREGEYKRLYQAQEQWYKSESGGAS